MPYDPYKHHRRSIRLKEYDYSQSGAYYITICTNDGQKHLGEIQDGVMQPSEAGLMIISIWKSLQERFPTIELDAFVLMPNHIHFIFFILTPGFTQGQNPLIVGNIVGAFKSISTNRYIEGVHEHGWPAFHKRFWQRNFYERIIRNEQELENIRRYIFNNPANWESDQLNPLAPPNQFNQQFDRL